MAIQHDFASKDLTTTIVQPYPAGVTPESVVAILHNHEAYIRATTPQLISFKHVSGTPGIDQTVEYEIRDKKPLGEAVYPSWITDRADGIETQVKAKAPMGAMTITSKWVAKPTELEERLWVDGNMLVRKLVKTTSEKSHPDAHKALFAQAGAAA